MPASFKTEGSLDLYSVRYYGVKYESELFPAAMFTKDFVHFTCFHTGSVLITGIKRLKQLYNTRTPILTELPLL